MPKTVVSQDNAARVNDNANLIWGAGTDKLSPGNQRNLCSSDQATALLYSLNALTLRSR